MDGWHQSLSANQSSSDPASSPPTLESSVIQTSDGSGAQSVNVDSGRLPVLTKNSKRFIDFHACRSIEGAQIMGGRCWRFLKMGKSHKSSQGLLARV